MKRRSFIKGVAVSLPGSLLFRGQAADQAGTTPKGAYDPGRITNEYAAFLPGEETSLSQPLAVIEFDLKAETVDARIAGQSGTLRIGQSTQAPTCQSAILRGAFR